MIKIFTLNPADTICTDLQRHTMASRGVHLFYQCLSTISFIFKYSLEAISVLLRPLKIQAESLLRALRLDAYSPAIYNRWPSLDFSSTG